MPSDLEMKATLRERITLLIAQCDHEAGQLDVSLKEIDNAKFAVIAFIDEVLASTRWAGQSAWKENPLQLTYFKRFDAGSEFFNRLKVLKEHAASNTEVLEVYYLCLALGFKGANEQVGRNELPLLKGDIFSELNRTLQLTEQPLSPHGLSKMARVQGKKMKVPVRMIIGILALIGIAYYLILRFRAGAMAEETEALFSSVALFLVFPFNKFWT